MFWCACYCFAAAFSMKINRYNTPRSRTTDYRQENAGHRCSLTSENKERNEDVSRSSCVKLPARTVQFALLSVKRWLCSSLTSDIEGRYKENWRKKLRSSRVRVSNSRSHWLYKVAYLLVVTDKCTRNKSSGRWYYNNMTEFVLFSF